MAWGPFNAGGGGQTDYCGYLTEKLELIDIGKPETLARAEEFLRENIVS